MKSVPLALALIVLTASIAAANAPMSSRIVQHSSAKVSIISCDAHIQDSDVTADFYIEDGFSISNDGDRSIVAVRVRFDFYNTFGEHLGQRFATYDTTEISPGQILNQNNQYQSVNIWNDGPKSATCTLDTVKYSDGTSWHVESAHDTNSGATLSIDSHLWAGAGSALNPMTAGHPKFCTVGGKAPLWNSKDCTGARAAWKIRKPTTPQPSAKP